MCDITAPYPGACPKRSVFLSRRTQHSTVAPNRINLSLHVSAVKLLLLACMGRKKSTNFSRKYSECLASLLDFPPEGPVLAQDTRKPICRSTRGQRQILFRM